MSYEELREQVPAATVLGDLTVAPMPEGTRAEAVFMLIKLDNGEWSARSIGPTYNRIEFLGQLSAYTSGLLQSEAAGWFEDDDPNT